MSSEEYEVEKIIDHKVIKRGKVSTHPMLLLYISLINFLSLSLSFFLHLYKESDI